MHSVKAVKTYPVRILRCATPTKPEQIYSKFYVIRVIFDDSFRYAS